MAKTSEKSSFLVTCKSQLIAVAAATMTVLCVLWNIDLPTRLGVAFLTEQYMAVQLGLALLILFMGFSGHKIGQWIGLLSALVVVLSLGYMAVNYDDLLAEQAYRPPVLTVLGSVVVFGVLEGVRRRAGTALFGIILVFLVYALFADKVPGALVGQEMTPVKLVQYLGFDPGAVFSTPLAVGTVIVVLFVFSSHL